MLDKVVEIKMSVRDVNRIVELIESEKNDLDRIMRNMSVQAVAQADPKHLIKEPERSDIDIQIEKDLSQNVNQTENGTSGNTGDTESVNSNKS